MIPERPAGVGVWANVVGAQASVSSYSVKAHLDLCHHWPLKIHTDMAYCLTVSKSPKTIIFIDLTSEHFIYLKQINK